MNYRLAILITGAVSIFLTSASHADEPAGQVYSLQTLEQIAQQNNPKLQQFYAEVWAARGKALQTSLYPNPSLEAGANQLGGVAGQHIALLSQEIVYGPKRRLEKAAASKVIQQAESAFLKERFALLAKVRQHYIAVLASQEREKVLGELARIARQARDTAARAVEGGEGTAAEVIQYEIDAQNMEYAHDNERLSRVAALRQLATVIGQPDFPLGAVTGQLAASLPAFRAGLPHTPLVENNAELRHAQLDVERARLFVERARVESIPNVTVTAGYMYSVEAPNNLAILLFSVPLPVWHRNQGNIQTAHADLGKATANVEATRADLASRLHAQVARYESAERQVERLRSKVRPLAEQGVALAQQAFDQRQFDLFKLLVSKKTRAEAELAYISAQERRWLAAAELSALLQMESLLAP